MEHAKKMVLVDPRMLHQPSDMTIARPELGTLGSTLTGLDSGLRQILDRGDVPEDEKVKLYNNYLQQYLTLKRKQTDIYNRPTPVAVSGDKAAADAPQSDAIEDQIMASVPKTFQKPAALLLKRVKADPAMGWNARGELVVDGNSIPNSNMVDLVNDIIRKRKNFSPVGWEVFSRRLRAGNIPQDLVRNPDRLAYMVGSPPASDADVRMAIERLRHATPSRSKRRRAVQSSAAPAWSTL